MRAVFILKCMCMYLSLAIGKLCTGDVAIVISHSGDTDEIVHAVDLIKRKNVQVLSIVGCKGKDVLCYYRCVIIRVLNWVKI